jgi:hypothetical protein
MNWLAAGLGHHLAVINNIIRHTYGTTPWCKGWVICKQVFKITSVPWRTDSPRCQFKAVPTEIWSSDSVSEQLQCLEHSFWRFQRSFLSLLPNSSSTTSVLSPSAILSSSATTSGWLDLLVLDAKGGEIWRSDVWSLGGAHRFTWFGTIALHLHV